MIISECETGDGEIGEGRLKFALQCMRVHGLRMVKPVSSLVVIW
jgi:hypothetical protein